MMESVRSKAIDFSVWGLFCKEFIRIACHFQAGKDFRTSWRDPRGTPSGDSIDGIPHPRHSLMAQAKPQPQPPAQDPVKRRAIRRLIAALALIAIAVAGLALVERMARKKSKTPPPAPVAQTAPAPDAPSTPEPPAASPPADTASGETPAAESATDAPTEPPPPRRSGNPRSHHRRPHRPRHRRNPAKARPRPSHSVRGNGRPCGTRRFGLCLPRISCRSRRRRFQRLQTRPPRPRPPPPPR
jgi:hypothetical protein